MSISELFSNPSVSYTNLNVSSVETKQLNGGSPFATYNGGCVGFSSPYTLGSILSGSSLQNNNISLPPTYWTLSDCKLTYNGPSGLVFYYATGCGFLSNTVGSYDFTIYVNGVQDTNNLNAIYVGQTSSVSVGQITGTRVFNTGDYIQVSFNKGSDIIGSPIVTAFGMGFVLFRVY